MDDKDVQALSHVLWIGGATDAGKTTVAHILAGSYKLQVYEYVRFGRRQITELAPPDPPPLSDLSGRVYRGALGAG